MDTSIIVVSFNSLSATHQCITSLLRILGPSRELIVIDNDSKDGSREYVQKLNDIAPNIKGILLDQNVGPGAARNVGFSHATGRNVLFLDNDTYALEGSDFIRMLEDKLDALNADIVGMCGIFTFDCKTYIHVHQRDVKKPLQVMAVTGYCMMIKKASFSALVGFDPVYGIFADEDLDLCFRALQKEMKVFVVDGVPMVHTEHGSGFATSDKFNEAIVKNHEILDKRFCKYFEGRKLDNYKISLTDCLVENKFELIQTSKIGKYYFFDSSSKS